MIFGHSLDVGAFDDAVFWLAIVAIMFVMSFFGYRERASRHRMIETLAEKGQPIPPELIDNGRRSYRRYGRSISSGIYLMCIGAALAVFFWAMQGGGNLFDGEHTPHWLPFIGVFPFAVGLARVLSGIFDRPPSP